jgi:hypothetical protein
MYESGASPAAPRSPAATAHGEESVVGKVCLRGIGGKEGKQTQETEELESSLGRQARGASREQEPGLDSASGSGAAPSPAHTFLFYRIQRAVHKGGEACRLVVCEGGQVQRLVLQERGAEWGGCAGGGGGGRQWCSSARTLALLCDLSNM